jgi:hypothetical protein
MAAAVPTSSVALPYLALVSRPSSKARYSDVFPGEESGSAVASASAGAAAVSAVVPDGWRGAPADTVAATTNRVTRAGSGCRITIHIEVPVQKARVDPTDRLLRCPLADATGLMNYFYPLQARLDVLQRPLTFYYSMERVFPSG